MTKEIYILREAKLKKGKKSDEDFIKGLSKRGKKQAKMLKDILVKEGIDFDVIISSPSCGAKETLDGLGAVIGNIPVIYEEDIYKGSPKVLLELLQELDDEYEKVLLIGDNPSIKILSIALSDTKSSKIKALKRILKGFKSASLCCFDGKIASWKEVSVDSLALTEFIESEI